MIYWRERERELDGNELANYLHSFLCQPTTTTTTKVLRVKKQISDCKFSVDFLFKVESSSRFWSTDRCLLESSRAKSQKKKKTVNTKNVVKKAFSRDFEIFLKKL